MEELDRYSAMLTKFEYFQLPCSTYSYEKMVDTEITYKLMIQIYVSFQVFTAGVAGLFWVLNAEKLRVFENRVLRRVFGPKRDEVTG